MGYFSNGLETSVSFSNQQIPPHIANQLIVRLTREHQPFKPQGS